MVILHTHTITLTFSQSKSKKKKQNKRKQKNHDLLEIDRAGTESETILILKNFIVRIYLFNSALKWWSTPLRSCFFLFKQKRRGSFYSAAVSQTLGLWHS